MNLNQTASSSSENIQGLPESNKQQVSVDLRDYFAILLYYKWGILFISISKPAAALCPPNCITCSLHCSIAS